MYTLLLTLHSLTRWLVLASLLLALYRSFSGLKSKRPFSAGDNALRHWTATLGHIQLVFGIWLYCISPLVSYFYADFKTAVHLREPRFFGMEHSLVMLSAIVILSIGSMKAKRCSTDQEKFKTIQRWYGIALLMILSSIPWSFSPLVHRPLWRFIL